MAFAEAALAALLSKAGAVAAGTALAVGGVGAAATGNLPDDLQARVDTLLSTERGAPETLEVVEGDGHRQDEGHRNDAAQGGNGKGEAVSNAARTAGEGLEGRARGEAISNAVRAANGSAGKGQGAEQRAAAKDRAAARGGNADDAGAAGQAEERRPDAADERADAGPADADVDPGRAEAGRADAATDDVDEGGNEFDADRPADAGAAREGASQRRATPDADG